MDSDEAKHKKMAEALIHTKVDICEIDAIVVYNKGVKEEVEKVFKQNGLKAPDILFEHDYKILNPHCSHPSCNSLISNIRIF